MMGVRVKQGEQPPLRLCLAKEQMGKAKVSLLTSILDDQKLTLPQIIEFYKLRWGIEAEFRGLKQTLERAYLRCRNTQ